MSRFIVTLTIAAVALASCGGGSSSTPPVAKSASVARGNVTFSILVPGNGVTTGGKTRRPAYVSASTGSISFQVSGGSPQVVPLTLGSATCPAQPGGYTCSASASVTAGATQLTVATFASSDGSGPALSQNTLPITIVADQTNPVNVTLNGVAATFAVFPTPATVSEGTPATISVAWFALDAAGNTIVGPGSIVNASGATVAPALSVSDTANFTVGAASGNTWPVAYNGAVTSSPVTFTVTNGGVRSATGTATILATGQRLFVANTGPTDSVSVYDAPYNLSPTVITSGMSTRSTFNVAVNASFDVFVPNSSANTVTMFAPPYTGSPAVTIPITNPRGVALDNNGDLFVSAINSVQEFVPPYTGAPAATITTGVNGPYALVLDQSGNLFVENVGNFTVTVFAPPYTAAPTVISTGCPPTPCLEPISQIAVIPGTSEVAFPNDAYATTGYTSPYLGIAPAFTVPSGGNGADGIAINAAGDLFVSYYNTNTVAEYAPPYTGGATATITNGINLPEQLSVDRSGNLFVANTNDTVTEYAPPYTGAPIETINTISTGGSYPFSTALSP